jgi:hypothetical protein
LEVEKISGGTLAYLNVEAITDFIWFCIRYANHFIRNLMNAFIIPTHPNIFQFLSVLNDFQCEVYIKIHTANRFVKKVRKDIAEKQKLVNTKIAACYV